MLWKKISIHNNNIAEWHYLNCIGAREMADLPLGMRCMKVGCAGRNSCHRREVNFEREVARITPCARPAGCPRASPRTCSPYRILFPASSWNGPWPVNVRPSTAPYGIQRCALLDLITPDGRTYSLTYAGAPYTSGNYQFHLTTTSHNVEVPPEGGTIRFTRKVALPANGTLRARVIQTAGRYTASGCQVYTNDTGVYDVPIYDMLYDTKSAAILCVWLDVPGLTATNTYVAVGPPPTASIAHNAQADASKDTNADRARVAVTLEQHSQASLAEIVKNGNDDVMRLAAIDRLHDHAVLAGIAKNGKGLQVREAAARKLNADEYKVLLDEIAQNVNEDDSTRVKLLAKLNPGVEYDIRIGSLDEDCNGRPRVVLVASPKPTEEEIFRWKMKKALPYYSVTSMAPRLTTLGQLSKMCDHVVIGKVVSLDKKDTLVLNVETVLFGDIPFRKFFPSRRISIAGGRWLSDEHYEKTIKSEHPVLPFPWRMEKRPAPGDRLLVFLSAGPSPEYVLPYYSIFTLH